MDKKQIGIWLDQKQAYLIQLHPTKTEVQHVPSNIEDYHVVGGARSKVPWGPMDKVSEKKALERRKHQFQQYFQALLQLAQTADELYLFGPAVTKHKFQQMIETQVTNGPVIHLVENADKMTERQMIAQVRQAFGRELPRFSPP
ncbi:MAG: hypothetical protein AAGD05_16415, partial [Bacteroidota bacterium]